MLCREHESTEKGLFVWLDSCFNREMYCTNTFFHPEKGFEMVQRKGDRKTWF
jgi:hypothetical protein